MFSEGSILPESKVANYRNITIAIDVQTYRQIRQWCAMRDVSVSHVVKTFLNDLPRLEKIRRFPTPEAPDPGSLGELFDRAEQEDHLHTEGIERLRRGLRVPLPPRLRDVKL